ncbi:MAG: hypothetical protein RMZ42_00540 [Nostoc sp. DedQUE05]|uniref:hypothetical protein n=1 Tax=Nostoc sp. DedQUE05 TaxID=3075391 RepID=UPI002AD50FF0|nr:hypothetical protein [Nostoc sp. DedQUE05]MDZ8090427.1 hypothetical protein [Nostoc sp. DedQUE05]
MSDYPKDETSFELFQRYQRINDENQLFLDELEAIENFFCDTDRFDNMKQLASLCVSNLSKIQNPLGKTITRLSIPAAQLIRIYPEYAEALKKLTQAMQIINDAVELIESAEDNFNIRNEEKFRNTGR